MLETLDSLFSDYVMNRERDAHEAAAGGARRDSRVGAAQPAIELFQSDCPRLEWRVRLRGTESRHKASYPSKGAVDGRWVHNDAESA